MVRGWSRLLLSASFSALACADPSTVAAPAEPRTAFVASDLAIVYPLPTAAEARALLGPTDEATGESRLPANAFPGDVLPELDASDPRGTAAAWASLRVVVARLDPCPGVVLPLGPTQRAEEVCAPELRLVFQSLVEDGSLGTLRARDGAIHAFYSLSFAALDDTLRALVAAAPALTDEPLGVHPRLAQEGLAGPFADTLRKQLGALATPATLFRVTHFRRAPDDETGPRWVFRLRDRRGAAFFDENVPSTWALEQTARPREEPASFSPAIAPTLTGAEDVTAVFRVAAAERAAAFRATVRVSSPSAHSANSIDCASCHLAGPIAREAERRFGLDATKGPDAFSSPSLRAIAPAIVDRADDDLHLLSYRGTQLGIARRTAHEVAASLDFLSLAGRSGGRRP